MSTVTLGLSTSDAARRLGVDRATVVNMINDGRLKGKRDSQPVKPRWIVLTNTDGLLVSPNGEVLPNQAESPGMVIEKRIGQLADRVDALEARREAQVDRPSETERLREAALLLASTLEMQREAYQLGSQANHLLSEALAEQGKIIATLLVPDSIEHSVRGRSG